MQGILEVKSKVKAVLEARIGESFDGVIEELVDIDAARKLLMAVEAMKSKDGKDYLDIIRFYISGQSRPDRFGNAG